jgi:hypothetical protein
VQSVERSRVTLDTGVAKCLGLAASSLPSKPPLGRSRLQSRISSLHHLRGSCVTHHHLDLAAVHDPSATLNVLVVQGSTNRCSIVFSLLPTVTASPFDAAKSDSLQSFCTPQTASQTSALFPIADSRAAQDLAPCGHNRAVIGRLQAILRLAAYCQQLLPVPALPPAGTNV